MSSLASLKKAYGDIDYVPELLSSGVIGTDLVLGGGYDWGSIHELFGLSKTGKSYFMQLAAVEAQRAYDDAIAVIYDRENAYKKQRMVAAGFDMSRTIVIPGNQIQTVDVLYEVYLDVTEKIRAMTVADDAGDDQSAEDPTLDDKKKKKRRAFTKKLRRIVHIVDSIPAFAETMEYVEDQGRRAKAWHATLRRITGAIDPHQIVLVSNHITYKPGLYGNPETKTGGVGINYYRDSGMKLSNVCDLYDSKERKVGYWIAAEGDKNRRGAMHTATMFPLYFGSGAHRCSGILEYMRILGIAELANPTAWKEKKGKVWPNYKVGGAAINERDPEVLQKFVEKMGIMAQIAEAEKAVFV